MSAVRTLLGWIATTGGIALVTAVVFELVLRVYNPIDLPLRGTRIILPVGKRVIFENPVENSRLDPEMVVTYNSIGFRGPDPPRDWDAHYTILTVGGSTTHSARQSDGLDWPSHVRRALEEEFENVWLNNAGLEGHSTIGHRYLLEQFLVDLRPRMVTLLVGANDRGAYDKQDLDAKHQVDKQPLVGKVVANSELLSTALVLWRVNRADRQGLHHWEFDLENNPRVDLASEDREGVLAPHRERYSAGFRDRVAGLVRLCREAGIEPVLITQPGFYGDGVDPRTGLEVGTLSVGESSASLAGAVLETYNDVTREVARAEGVLLIDLAVEMPLDSTYFYDWIHFTNAGSEEVARIVSRHLIEHLREKPDLRAAASR